MGRIYRHIIDKAHLYTPIAFGLAMAAFDEYSSRKCGVSTKPMLAYITGASLGAFAGLNVKIAAEIDRQNREYVTKE